MMIFVNVALKAPSVSRETVDTFLRILAPFAPHMVEELFAMRGADEGVTYAAWPSFDEAKLTVDRITVAVQVNGKMRGKLEIDASASKDEILAAAKALDTVQRFTDGKSLRREIYVPGRLVNLVVG